MTTWTGVLARSSAADTWLVDFYLAATVLLMAALAVMALIRQPSHRVLIARAALAGAIVLAVLSAVQQRPKFAMLSARAAEASAAARSARFAPVPAVGHRSMPASVENFTTINPDTQDEQSKEHSATLSDEPPLGKSAARSGLAFAPSWWSGSALFTGYLAGMAMVSVWLVIGQFRVRRICRAASPAPANLTAQLAQLIGSRAPRVRLLVSGRVSTAVALGPIHPTILLSRDLASSPSAAAALAHEWAHIRYGDLIWLAVGRVGLLLLYAHPLWWLLQLRLRDAQELRADAAAAETIGHTNLAEQLVGWARRQRPAGLAGLGAVGLWESRRGLAHRIAVLLDESRTIATVTTRRWRLAVAALAALFIAGSSTLVVWESVEPVSAWGQEAPHVDRDSDQRESPRFSHDGIEPAPMEPTPFLYSRTSPDSVFRSWAEARSELPIEINISDNTVLRDGDITLDVSITNRSKAPIATRFGHEWYGGEWPPTNLYASVTPAGAEKEAAFAPVYLQGERGEVIPSETIGVGQARRVTLRMDWPGTGSVKGTPLMSPDRAGSYRVRLLFVFEQEGRHQYVICPSANVSIDRSLTLPDSTE